MKECLLVSSCFAGNKTKYNGQDNYLEKLSALKEKYRLIFVCPEVAGGLSIPRNPSERVGELVVSNKGDDVSCEYLKGAYVALLLVIKYKIKKALLKESSPSCGSNLIYDGTFTGKKIPGKGVTAEVLERNGVKVYSEFNIDELL